MNFPMRGFGLRCASFLALGLVSLPAASAIRDSNTCPIISPTIEVEAGRSIPDVCYSGFTCILGLRGDWLDITDKVTIASAPAAGGPMPYPRLSITEAGADVRARERCVPPSNRTREGFVAIKLEDITTTGRFRVTASRTGNIGINRDSDSRDVEIRNGGHFLDLVAANRQPLSARAGQVREMDLTGRGLQALRAKVDARQPFPAASNGQAGNSPGVRGIAATSAALRQPMSATRLPSNAQLVSLEPAPFEIVSARFDSARIRVNVLRPGIVNLEDYFEFANVGGVATVPAINNDLGWPRLDVRP